MLIAMNPARERLQAARDLASGDFLCPMCEGPVILKRGRKVSAHFAHTPGANCAFAEGESWRHLMAKQVLLDEFTALGWEARVEVAHPKHARRVDVGVKVPDTAGAMRYVAVEVQDSAIQVETMKQRVMSDQRIGYAATAWLFTSHRAGSLIMAYDADMEVRVPPEMLWVANRYGDGVPIIDPEARSIRIAELARVVRPGESYEWYEEGGELAGVDYPDRVLRSTRKVPSLREGGFRLWFAPGKFGDKLATRYGR